MNLHHIERSERVRQAFGLIVAAARVQQEMLDLERFERGIGRPPWRDLLKALRHDRHRFAAVMGDKSARSVLRWGLDRALEARPLQQESGRTDRHDRVVFVQGVDRAYELLTGKPLGRSLTAEQRPTGPGVRLVRMCLAPLDPLVTDDAIVWAIRCAQAQPWQATDSPA